MTEEFLPFNGVDRTLMWRVLSIWVKATTLPSNDLVRELKSAFTPARADALLESIPIKPHPFKLTDQRVWIIGGELSRQANVYPVVTFQAAGDKAQVTKAAFRVALIRRIGAADLEAHGWRFEQAESYEDYESADDRRREAVRAGEEVDDTSAHPYAHAQAIIGWEKGFNCLIHASHTTATCTGLASATHHLVDAERVRAQKNTLAKHPAFPLGVTTLTGLALAVFTTLYGAREGRRVFGKVRQLVASTGALRQDLESLSILDPVAAS